jgi:RimJ/RimL family protein N-acetyltransferase
MTLRPLTESDWAALRRIRLHALQTEPGVYSSTYDLECEKTGEDWRWLAVGDERHQLFGLFEGETIAGITAVFADRDDPSGQTAVLAMSYISPAHRGQGLSRSFYEARLNWIRSKPQFTRVRVSHRRSNDASRRANQRFGFREIGTRETAWPDGGVEEEVRYEMAIERT